MSDNKLRLENGMIAGVCGGLGTFFGIRPFWFRLAARIARLSAPVQ